jgi:hypothetical protein
VSVATQLWIDRVFNARPELIAMCRAWLSVLVCSVAVGVCSVVVGRGMLVSTNCMALLHTCQNQVLWLDICLPANNRAICFNS